MMHSQPEALLPGVVLQEIPEALPPREISPSFECGWPQVV